jgi:hypothetical protein
MKAALVYFEDIFGPLVKMRHRNNMNNVYESRIFDILFFSCFKLRGPSPQANYTDRATAAVGEVVPTFADRGCYVGSATDSHGR